MAVSLDGETKTAKVLSISQINEIPIKDIDETLVRTVGRLSRHEPVQHEAFIVDPLQTPGSPDSSELRVDTLFIESMPSAQLVQFIGEMAYSAERNERFLRASAAKDVSDLDVRMYTKALEQRQRYLSSRNCQATPMDISEDG